jgi:hypothetical protein
MGEVDVYQIINLGMSELTHEIIVSPNEIKPEKYTDFEFRFESLRSEVLRERVQSHETKNNN